MVLNETNVQINKNKCFNPIYFELKKNAKFLFLGIEIMMRINYFVTLILYLYLGTPPIGTV